MDASYQPLIDQEENLDIEKVMDSTFKNCYELKGNVTQIFPVYQNGQHIVAVGCEDGKICVVGNDVKYLAGHKLQVRRVLLTNDQRFIITSSRDKTVKVWEIATGQEVDSFDCGTDIVSISLFRQLVMAGGENGNVFVIDINSKSKVQLEGHKEMVRWVSFAPNGETLYSLSNDKTVKVYSADYQVIAVLEGHKEWVNRIDFTSDSELAVTGSNDKNVIIWNLQQFTLDTVLESHTDQIWSICVSPNNKWAASGSNDKTVCLWNLPARSLQFKFTGHTHQVPHVKFSADSLFIASASFDKTVKLWNTESLKIEASFEGHTHFVRCVEFSPDGCTIFSGGADKSLRKWNLQINKTSSILKGHTDWVRRLAVLPNGQRFVSSGKDKSVRLWNIKGQLEHTFNGHTDEVWGLTVTPDSEYILSGSHDKTLKMWNIKTKSLEHNFTGHEGWIIFVLVTPDGKFAITPSYDTTIGVWDLEKKELVTKMQGHQGAVNRIIMNGSLVFSGSLDKTVKMWDLGSCKCIGTFTEHNENILALAVSSDNRVLVTGCNDKCLRFYSVDMKAIIKQVDNAHEGDINRLLITPDCSVAVSCSDDKTIKIWDLNSYTLKWVMEGHTNIVTWIEMTSDGKYIVSASRDKTVKVWNLEKVSLEVSFDNHTDVLYSLAISPNNEFAISGSFDKTIAVHLLFNSQSNQLKYHGIFNTSLEGTCKVLGYKRSAFSEDQKNALVLPLHVNILHLYSFLDKQEDMKFALEANTPYFISSRFGSPMNLAISRNNFEIINIIIEYFGRVSTEKPVRYDLFATIKEDLYPLLKIRLRSISDLLTNLPLIGNRNDLIKYIGFDVRLPEIKFSDMHFFHNSLFQYQSSSSSLIQVNYYAVPFRLNLEHGSSQSLELLKVLEVSPNRAMFVSRLVTAIIDYKWRELRVYFTIEFILYIVYLIMMCYYLTIHNITISGFSIIMIINTIGLIIELLQLFEDPLMYLKSFWNMIDLIRILYCYALVSALFFYEFKSESNHVIYAKLIIMILCWARGLGYFKMFDRTRYFVTMLSDILDDSLGFTTIFFYTIFAFSNLMLVITNDSTFNMTKVFETMFETIFGAGNVLDINSDSERVKWLLFFFATLIVTVVMLNLLISIFGDTYDRVQMEMAETSNMLKISMIYDIEKVLFWKRNSGSPSYMIICEKIESESDEWEGKVKAVIKTVGQIEINQSKISQSLSSQLQRQNEETKTSIQNLEEKLSLISSKLDSLASLVK